MSIAQKWGGLTHFVSSDGKISSIRENVVAEYERLQTERAKIFPLFTNPQPELIEEPHVDGENSPNQDESAE